jgi:site-specific DNA recombinase
MRALLELVDYLKSCDVAVRSATEPFDMGTPMGECMFNLMGNFAQLEQGMLVERVKLGLRRRWEQGKWKGGDPPYGYDYNRETEKLEVNEEEAKVVRKVFKHYLRVKSMRMVTNYLNRKEIPTRNGGMWIDSTIGRILSRGTYDGVLRIGNVVNEMPELRIISKRTFGRVEALRKKRRKFMPKNHSRSITLDVEIHCNRCGIMVLPGMRFCPSCGIEQGDLEATGCNQRQFLQRVG